MSNDEKSFQQYAALCFGDDATGTWLWCHLHGDVDTKRPFYAQVINGAWELKYDPVSRLGTVSATKQQIMGLRLAGIGRVPKHWVEEHDYNSIISNFLATGEYRTVEYFVQ